MEQDTLNKTKILKPSPDGAGEKPTSNPSRSKVRGPGKSLSKSSHRSEESSTDRGKENLARAPAAKLSSPSKETRHAIVERSIKSKYLEANGVPCAWNGRAGKALKDFLDERPGWTTEEITQCVTNRFKSVGVVLSDDPHFWIPKLAGFLQGPKDKFGKTTTELAGAPKMKAPRAVEHVPPPAAQPDKVKLLARFKEPISHAVDDSETPGFFGEPRAIGRLQ